MSTETTVTSRTVNGVRHLAVSKVRGRLSTFEGTLELAEDPTRSKASVTIDATSVDTREETRDNHLRTNDFFDVENHPSWTFTSTSIKAESPTEFKVVGDLTIRGVTKPVTLHVTYEGVVQDPWGNHRVGFSGSTSINRDEFGVSFGAVADASGSILLAKKVDIQIELEAVLQA
jgi:polyisoprenoid-binding protein YceI